MANEDIALVTIERIQSLIYFIRGKQVMVDSDLAVLYQVETGNLNKAMKRNQKRFPEDFCFQVTKDEYDNLIFQSGSSSGEHGGRRTLPYVYTEQGIAMLSAVLRSEVAIQVSIQIMKTFVELRRYIAHGALLMEKVNNLETKQREADQERERFEERTEKRLEEIFDYIASHEESTQRIFYDGQIFDAFVLLIKLIGEAERDIILIDGYVDIVTLNLLSKKADNVQVSIYTYPSARITSQDITNFNAQYPRLEVKRTTVFHDRFLIIDGTYGYHIGASLKDAGKKCFCVNKIEDKEVINGLVQRAESACQSN